MGRRRIHYLSLSSNFTLVTHCGFNMLVLSHNLSLFSHIRNGQHMQTLYHSRLPARQRMQVHAHHSRRTGSENVTRKRSAAVRRITTALLQLQQPGSAVTVCVFLSYSHFFLIFSFCIILYIMLNKSRYLFKFKFKSEAQHV